MKNEIRRDGQTLSLANWRMEVRAEKNLKIKGKIFTNTLSADMGGWFETIKQAHFANLSKAEMSIFFGNMIISHHWQILNRGL